MSRVRMHHGFVVGGVFVLAGCSGGHLEAVQVTGAVGSRLSAHEASIDALPATCIEVATLSGSSEDCTALRARARSWVRLVALLDAYARGLRSEAASRREGALAVDTAGDAWPELTPAQAQAAKTLSSAVRAMLLQAPGESDPRSTIASSDAAIQEIARGVDRVVAQELDRLELARTAIDVVRDRLQQLATMPPPARHAAPAASTTSASPAAPPAAPAPPASAGTHPPDKTSALFATQLASQIATLRDRLDDALSERAAERATERQVVVPGSLAELGLLQDDLESKRARLERLRDTVDAFARAHKALHDNIDRLGRDEILAEVVRAISQPSGGESAQPAPSAVPGSP